MLSTVSGSLAEDRPPDLEVIMRYYPVRCASAEWRYEQPLVDIERETLPLEWSAALYESHAADHEHLEAAALYPDTAPEAVAAARHADTALALAERIEREAYAAT
ncbi:hypothetical protein [Streptomyces sp. CA-106131]|uniref:hypothetical protein n=1 Tax=Streptomyces sp. CA-106131 TaxID=3240045 RepID=UPI003D8F7519